MSNIKLTTNQAWQKLLTEYNIVQEVEENRTFEILSSEIKEYREPRLMAKWDSSTFLPKSLKDKDLTILPTSRYKYTVGDFELYQSIPPVKQSVVDMKRVVLPELETVDVNDINSEAKAINVLKISNVLNDFLGEEKLLETFNGKMSVGNFDFNVLNKRNELITLNVDRSQCEIDGGFESDQSVIIMEAKNIPMDDFIIRQLYYPYRLWLNKVNKPIRLVYSIYTNQIFRLYEYQFNDYNNYSSIELIQNKNYSLQDTTITYDDLYGVYQNTKVVTDDAIDSSEVPFIQANSFERVISLMENLYDNPMTVTGVSILYSFDKRQSDYYFNALRYLGLAERVLDGSDRRSYMQLTKKGIYAHNLNYKERQLYLLSVILEHKIFNELFIESFNQKSIPTTDGIAQLILKYKVVENLVTAKRRASSVKRWLEWIFSLVSE
ncbi:type II restriction enzyme [Fundicoccus culcitae]|uniref:Type II restriction endonuclease n=1 Tax=Fundicoccus culcitae TaxID=2969821 RepID=A0ABY5P4C6_9LACT|nr:type II restriction endonuclease [Fundicoccus culcitae]UUX33552.1 type II restriction endonuclease [Fundicoccus culcitae]